MPIGQSLRDALASEVNNDPAGLYDPSDSDQQIANKLNNQTIYPTSTSMRVVYDAFTPADGIQADLIQAEIVALAVINRQFLIAWLSRPDFDPSPQNGDVRWLQFIVTGATATIASLTAQIQAQRISRREQLGFPRDVTASDVNRVRE